MKNVEPGPRNGYDQHSLNFMSRQGFPKRLPESVLVKPRPVRESVSSGDMPEAELTTKKRDALPNSAFALPRERRYPIPDLAHARNALARVAQNGTPAEQKAVRTAVYRKFPQLRK